MGNSIKKTYQNIVKYSETNQTETYFLLLCVTNLYNVLCVNKLYRDLPTNGSIYIFKYTCVFRHCWQTGTYTLALSLCRRKYKFVIKDTCIKCCNTLNLFLASSFNVIVYWKMDYFLSKSCNCFVYKQGRIYVRWNM